MKFPRMVRWIGAAGALALIPLASCASPRLQLRSPPSLSARLPTPPVLPEAQAQQSTRGGGTNTQRVTAARALGNLREQTILVVLDGESALTGAALELLPSTLIGARFTRVLLPPMVEGLEGTVERSAAGDRTVLSGRAVQLLPMRANTPVDGVLRIEVRHAGDVIEQTTRYEIPADALQRYAAELARYREALQRVQQQLAASSGYPAEVDAELAAYRQRGGRFDNEEDRQRIEDARSFVALYAQAEQQLRAAMAATPPSPEALQASARGRTSTDRNTTPGVRVRAVYSDVRAGETFWIDDIRAVGANPAEAISQALSTLIQDLGGAG